MKSTCCSGAPYPPDSTERNVGSNAAPFWPHREFASESWLPCDDPSISSSHASAAYAGATVAAFPGRCRTLCICVSVAPAAPTSIIVIVADTL